VSRWLVGGATLLGWILLAPANGWAEPQVDAAATTLLEESRLCVPWPDEPDPLPDVASEDPILARWARERAASLAEEALALEVQFPDRARALWERVRCLDPTLPALGAGARNMRKTALPGPVGRAGASLPGVSAQPPDVAAPDVAAGSSPEAPWPLLLASAGLRSATLIRAPIAPAEDLTDVDQELGEIGSLVEEAHFRTALAVASATRSLLQQAGDTPAVRVRRGRLEVLCATAAIALGHEEEARAYMEAALAQAPDLQLDATSTSPKVMALLGEARAAVVGDTASGNIP